MNTAPGKDPAAALPRGPEGWLFYLGSAALLFAMATDAIAVLGRHAGVPLLGSIELVQAAMLIASAAAIVSATVAAKHAVVHLLIDRLAAPIRGLLLRIHSGVCAVFFALLAAGSIWIAFDLRLGHEESELLRIPYAPLRVIIILAMMGAAWIHATRALRRAPT